MCCRNGGLAWGTAWTDTGRVFGREDGAPIHPERVSKMFEARVKAAGLPRIRFHDLRHSWATAALIEGLPARVVADVLGHSSTSITLDVYSHVTAGMGADATSRVARLFGGA